MLKRFFYIFIASVLFIVSLLCYFNNTKKDGLSLNNKVQIYSNNDCEPLNHEDWLSQIAPNLYTSEELEIKKEIDKILNLDDSIESIIYICNEI